MLSRYDGLGFMIVNASSSDPGQELKYAPRFAASIAPGPPPVSTVRPAVVRIALSSACAW